MCDLVFSGNLVALEMLSRPNFTVIEIVKSYGLKQKYVSRHLQTLRQRGLVIQNGEKEGRAVVWARTPMGSEVYHSIPASIRSQMRLPDGQCTA